MGLIRAILIAALLLVSSPAQAQFVGWSFYRWLDEQTSLSLSQAVATITEADQREWLGYLASAELDGRKPNTAGYRKAVEYVEAHCRHWGINTIRQTVPRWDDNLIAWIEGENPDKVLVIGAHLDHLGNGYLGADDNGSGSSALMGLAYAFSRMPKPPITVAFHWYTAEESGLIGSKHYVDNPILPRDNPSIRSHVGMINLDMVGWLRTTGGTVRATVPFAQHIRDLSPSYGFGPSILADVNRNNSDHAPFRRAGVPVVFLHTGLHNHYHKRTDTVDRINFLGLTRISRFAAELTWRVANDSQTVQSQLVRDCRTGRLYWNYSLAP